MTRAFTRSFRIGPSISCRRTADVTISSGAGAFGRTFGALFMGAALTLTLVGCGGASGAGAESGNSDGSLVGKPAPDFTAETVGGEGPKTVKEANGKVTIIDFWATYCGPCKKSFPKYQELVDQFGGEPEHDDQPFLAAISTGISDLPSQA